MNAYELADAVEDWETGANYTVSIKASQMLRQQADRIAELQKVNGRFADLIQSLREEVNKLREEVLMWENAEVPTEVMADMIEELESRGFITTPQTKPLSDDEILWVASTIALSDAIQFARAIEERHGIK